MSGEMMLRLLNMSFGSGVMVLLVVLIRWTAGRWLPKMYSYLLWFLVLFRLLCPFSVAVSSSVSLFPVNPEPVKQEILYEKVPEIDTGIVWLNQPVNGVLEENFRADDAGNSVNPIQIALAVWMVVWSLGFLGIWIWQCGKYWKLSRKLELAVRVEAYPDVFLSDRISGAFVLGIVRPRIYLSSLLEEKERSFVLAHERIHIRRKDYLVKGFWFLALAFHWFNPLVWIGFVLMCRDMEMACDEAAVRSFSGEERKAYSLALLHAAERQSGIWTVMAFGENHTKSRIKHILKGREPKVWMMAAGACMLGLAAVCFLTNPGEKNRSADAQNHGPESGAQESDAQKGDEQEIDAREGDAEERDVKEHPGDSVSIIGGADGPTSIFFAGKFDEDADMEPVDMEQLSRYTVTSGWKYEEETEPPENAVYLLAATDENLVFYGQEIGLFVFRKDGENWKAEEMFGREFDGSGQETIMKMLSEFDEKHKGRISKEDRFVEGADAHKRSFAAEGRSAREFDVVKWEDGRVAVLGGYEIENADAIRPSGRLCDLFYCYWDPKDSLIHQVYLFDGTGKETILDGLRDVQYLKTTGGWDYYLESPEELAELDEAIQKNGVWRYLLVRRKEGQEQIWNHNVAVSEEEPEFFLFTENRILYRGARTNTEEDFRTPCLISQSVGSQNEMEYYSPKNGEITRVAYRDGYVYFEETGESDKNGRNSYVYRSRDDFSEITLWSRTDGTEQMFEKVIAK
ncbi:MAG: M56 family metallopeptidase [Lachnospiraceae bacterium]|nr:M56 family metallopeptidase [Lachnospiraceae bacterium]